MGINPKMLLKAAGIFFKKNSPQILAAVAVVGVVSTGVTAAYATPKAVKLIDEARDENGDITKVDAIKAAWKVYIPAASLALATTACIVGGTGISLKRCATALAAYGAAEGHLTDYKKRVLETVGTEKAQEIQDHISQQALTSAPKVLPSSCEHHEGDTLFYDIWSGRYFYGDRNTIDRVVNRLNERMLANDVISLNEFYEGIGLDCTKGGQDVGWNRNDGLLELRYSAQVASNGDPCLVIDFFIEPSLLLPW